MNTHPHASVGKRGYRVIRPNQRPNQRPGQRPAHSLRIIGQRVQPPAPGFWKRLWHALFWPLDAEALHAHHRQQAALRAEREGTRPHQDMLGRLTLWPQAGGQNGPDQPWTR